jgi:hypothetical protein
VSAREPRTIARHRPTGVARRYPMVVGLLVTLASVPMAAAVLAGSASLTTSSRPRTPFVAGAPQDPVVVPGGGEATGPSVGIARPQSTSVPVSRNRPSRSEDLPIRVVREAAAVPVPSSRPDSGRVPVPMGTPSPTTSPSPSPAASSSPEASPSASPAPSPTGSPAASPAVDR